tara:strand:- start:2568 stop:4217 length:1650 start_codon:yes stop_codon:yes gene_type:complete
VSGAWGIGKTYLWSNIVLPRAGNVSPPPNSIGVAQQGAIEYDFYSYVSLFGLNSLAELKRAIFESKRSREKWHRPLAKADVTSNWRLNVKFLTKAAGQITRWGNAAEVIADQLSENVWDQIICIDDLERRGDNLSLRDVLGYVSYLKEQRRCKVLVLTNSGDFDEEDKVRYETFSEKVFDKTLVFSPSPGDCADIVEADDQLREKLLALGLSNIRIARRTKDFADEARGHLVDFASEVTSQAVHTLVLASWIKYSKDAPPLSFVAERHTLQFMEEHQSDDPDEKISAWTAILQVYGFGEIDAFDEVLIKFVDDGFLNVNALKREAEKLNKDAVIQAGSTRRVEAWRAVRESFGEDDDHVVDELIESYVSTMNNVYAVQLDRAVHLLRFMRRDKDADDLIDKYVAAHAGETKAFDLKRQREFGEKIDDPVLITRLSEVFGGAPREGTAIAAIIRADQYGENMDEDLQYANSASVADIAAYLKTLEGENFKQFIRACFASQAVVNARPEQRSIAAKAKQALQILAKESRLNKYRVRLLGVPIDEEEHKEGS